MAAARVLILEDDLAQSDALKRAFVKVGFEVFTTDRSEEAVDLIKTKNIQIMFADCLLPGQSGVDFVEGLRKSHSADHLAVVLMSGIFTDSGFVKDALRVTQAIGFLRKPFDVEEAIKLVPKDGSQVFEAVTPRKALYQTFNRGKLSVREKRKLIESLDEIHGYDLPFIYSLLVESKVSGNLNIVAANGDVSGISFSQGLIIGVDVADQETFLGKLLIESGYILSEDLERVLSQKTTKRIGERLISGNLLSPHAFNIVLSNQMNIRLSRTIVDMPVKINFGEAELETTTPNIDSGALVGFLHDWVAGKISLEWLKTHYMQWGHYPLALGSAYTADHPALKMPIVSSLNGFIADISRGGTLGQIVDSQKFPEGPLYKAIHFLLTKGILVFGEAPKVINSQDVAKMLKGIANQFQSKNKLEIYDFMAQMTNVSESMPDRVYQDFMALLKQADAPGLDKIRRGIEAKAKESYEFAKSGDRELLREEMAKAEIELKLKAGSQYEEAKNLLQKGQYTQALDILNRVLAVDRHLTKSKIYLAWAKLGVIESGGKNVDIKEVEMDLLQVSPEDKFDAIYVFVMGLFQRQSGDSAAARKAFEKALAMDSSMIVARRELTRLVNSQPVKKDMLNRDLRDIVSGIFGGKKK
jgi:ActR/RegA family two-component response regulator/tetratricopeptide (TPR) repeat protein